MAITTEDGVIAGMQPPRPFAKALTGTLVAGRPQSLWGLAGSPGAGGYDTTLNGAVLSSSSAQVAGQIPHTDPVSGNSYLARLVLASSAQPCVGILADLLWTNQLTVNVTTLQSITSPTWPARDAAASTNGDGVQIALVTSAAASATAVAGTLTYTNQAGTGSRTATILDATAATATIAGALFRIGLQAGDTGVRSVQSFQFSTAWTTGTINLIAYRPLATVIMPASGVGIPEDATTLGLPRLPNGVVPFVFIIPSTTTTTQINGSYTETQG